MKPHNIQALMSGTCPAHARDDMVTIMNIAMCRQWVRTNRQPRRVKIIENYRDNSE